MIDRPDELSSFDHTIGYSNPVEDLHLTVVFRCFLVEWVLLKVQLDADTSPSIFAPIVPISPFCHIQLVLPLK